jgi:hypothetical protein
MTCLKESKTDPQIFFPIEQTSKTGKTRADFVHLALIFSAIMNRSTGFKDIISCHTRSSTSNPLGSELSMFMKQLTEQLNFPECSVLQDTDNNVE